MFDIDVNKYRICTEDYTFDEFERNRNILIRMSNLKGCLVMLISVFFLRLLLHKYFLWVMIVSIVLGVCVKFMEYDSDVGRMKDKYFMEAEREWVIVSKSELLPRFKCPVDYSKFDESSYYNLVKRYRRDVVVKNKCVEFYILKTEKGYKRVSLPIYDVYFDTISDERSFLLWEKYSFVDNRFLSLEERYSSRYLSFRYTIQSKYIQW